MAKRILRIRVVNFHTATDNVNRKESYVKLTRLIKYYSYWVTDFAVIATHTVLANGPRRDETLTHSCRVNVYASVEGSFRDLYDTSCLNTQNVAAMHNVGLEWLLNYRCPKRE